MEQYIIHIFWSKKYMRDILSNKILAYIKREYPKSDEAKFKLKSDYNKLLDLVFKSPINWNGDRDAKLFEAISTFSNRRPRWMAQLCRMAASKAKTNPHARKIELDHINNILEDFGRNRKNDLIKEHQHQFDELEILIDAFRASVKEFKYTEINKILEDNFIKGRKKEISTVDGCKYCSPEDLGNFLYKLGLISRVHDDGKTFTHFSDDPDLYRSNENRHDKMLWSIHPSYRTFLNIR